MPYLIFAALVVFCIHFLRSVANATDQRKNILVSGMEIQYLAAKLSICQIELRQFCNTNVATIFYEKKYK